MSGFPASGHRLRADVLWSHAAVLAAVALLVAGAAFSAGCAQEEYPMALWSAEHPDAALWGDAPVEASVPIDAGRTGPLTCRQSRGESMPARLESIGAGANDGGMEAAVSGTTYTPALLFQRFTATCGACHGQVQGLGSFRIQTVDQFENNDWPTTLPHILSNGPTDPKKPQDPSDPKDPMPPFPPGSPTGMPYSQRPAGDLIRQLAELLQQWLMLGKPPSFFVPDANQAPPLESIPIPSGAVADDMTNVGSCVPSASLFATETKRSKELDDMFAAAAAKSSGTYREQIGLPEHLRDTDLVTLDSATLAQYGVVAYAPTYPLWSDSAVKLRHIRVPRGQSIHFDKATQNWTIPANTRFYKTFTKQVIDKDGSYRYRKIETRLIVARPDTPGVVGPTAPTALFGTYQWNDGESDAVLVETPRRDNTPWTDNVFVYKTDEPLAAEILASNPHDQDTALIEGRAGRHYAIPGKLRCIDCHQGSATQSFVLGFLPLQIKWRAKGTGGVIEDSYPDELDQLQRFIDYGIVTGMTSPDDVVPLEKSEGSRAPRNDYELIAQGYVLGNCSHCHNPRGLPSVANPVLVPLLNFLPGPNTGIFQFPLERYSPRIFRGTTGQTRIPYITPSLIDLPRYDPQSGTGAHLPDPFFATAVTSGGDEEYIRNAIYAPWRSLIYRNTDTPFSYTDDLGLFPHMPMNTAGYDPRAKQILSDWMVSIPAARKRPDISEYAFYKGSTIFNSASGIADEAEQPYAEVLPGDPRAPDALAAAAARLEILHSGQNPDLPTGPTTVVYSRWADQGQTDDILDSASAADPICHPVPVATQSISFSGGVTRSFPVPPHCHWVVTDTTQPPGPYTPRRPDWGSILVEQKPEAPSDETCGGRAGQTDADEAAAIKAVQSVHLDDASRSFLTKPGPFGLWVNKSGCNFPSQKTVADFTSLQRPARPLWMDLDTGLSPKAPVYMQTPGQAVFKMICINCHGPNADANGRLAANLNNMTGGLAQVANFSAGLFGPVSMPGANRDEAFTLPDDASQAWQATTSEERAARYMAWMALGGTKVQLPAGILTIVQQTKVLDQRRGAFGVVASANMLSTAKGICRSLLGDDDLFKDSFTPSNPTRYHNPLIHSNGDAELWLNLCSFNNPPPIHYISSDNKLPGTFSNGGFVSAAGLLVNADRYPAQTRVGNDRGGTEPYVASGSSLPAGQSPNLWPWCVVDGDPRCPISALTDPLSSGDWMSEDQAEAWAVHGAVNAGLAVFLYIESIEGKSPPPDYDQCEELQ